MRIERDSPKLFVIYYYLPEDFRSASKTENVELLPRCVLLFSPLFFVILLAAYLLLLLQNNSYLFVFLQSILIPPETFAKLFSCFSLIEDSIQYNTDSP